MINSFRNKQLANQKGAVTLVIAIILIVLSTLIIIFAANQGQMLDKLTGNLSRNMQAFEAAEAGMEFGINYLKVNNSSIIASATSGLISYSDANTNNISLANNSKFSVTFSNPVANNFNLITITSTGTSDDGTSTRIIKQNVQFGSLLSQPGNIPLTTKGSVSLAGNATITNMNSNSTINSSSSVTMGGSSQTVTSSGGSTPNHLSTDITQNNSTLANTSQTDFFANYFGTTNITNIQNKVGHYYTNGSDTNYSSNLNGLTGTSIWIDQTGGTATINGSTTIGSLANPVLLIVNGPLNLSGNVTIYGFIFVNGTTGISTLSGNTQIVGGMATTDTLNITGSISLTFNNTVLQNLQKQSSMMYFAKVPGTWRDF